MNLNATEIALRTLNGILVPDRSCSKDQEHPEAVLSLNAELMRLGYSCDEELFNALLRLSLSELSQVARDMIAALRSLCGDDVRYSPMYPNFPKQVMKAREAELYYNAMCHYWTQGQWQRSYYKLPRSFAFEHHKLRNLRLITREQFLDILPTLLRSQESLSELNQEIIRWFIRHEAPGAYSIPDEIPYAETRACLAAALLEQGQDFSIYVHSATDLLRVATALSGGDLSLASNTKFISFPRAQRKSMVRALEAVIREEDIGRHRNKWVRLFHSLHVGDYSKSVFAIAKKAREQGTLYSFHSQVELACSSGDVEAALLLLLKRPTELARRLDHLLRLCREPNMAMEISEMFLDVADQVPTRVLLQLKGHLSRRVSLTRDRVVYPKGSVQRAVILRDPLPALDFNAVALLLQGIRSQLEQRFASLPPLRASWVDPALRHCPLPVQQRSASAGLFQVARGTRLPIGNQSTLRCFIYWVGQDIDLSATLHDQNFRMIEQVSYTNLRSSGYQAVHSGDIVKAPNGAAEFIDIELDSAFRAGARYLAMNVLVFNGPSFAEHKVCYAGWMTRSRPNSNEVFDPKTVRQKVDLNGQTRNMIPVLFDLQERKAIWTDLSTGSEPRWGSNNVESNQASIEEKLEAAIRTDHRVSLYDLFSMHVNARGSQVWKKDEAEQLFSLEEGITPYHIAEINADYIG